MKGLVDLGGTRTYDLADDLPFDLSGLPLCMRLQLNLKVLLILKAHHRDRPRASKGSRCSLANETTRPDGGESVPRMERADSRNQLAYVVEREDEEEFHDAASTLPKLDSRPILKRAVVAQEPDDMTVSNDGVARACPPAIDFNEAIQDSPRFRAVLAQHMLRHVSAMIEHSKNYVNTFYKLTISVNQLCDESFSGNALAQATFQALSDAYAHTVSLSRTYYEHSNIVLYTKLSNFIKDELQKVTESRAHFDNMSASMDEALAKNAAASRSKPVDAVEGRNALTAVGACFAHTTLDYVAQINIAHAHKDHMIIDALWTLVRETSAFFAKGHAVFDEWTASDNGAVADSISAYTSKSKIVERKMQDVHSLVPKVGVGFVKDKYGK
ncbi:unnamed protein product [Caenorhabditis auriculariae]|uniref:BAR domain-containing protein n=1 Tax=Caenorhabditis auriculariae TaxID=2777116 RepID=A0A8S1HS02_9PELO|nr:unnamed protein product [Caenorhabditis auriculariae]